MISCPFFVHSTPISFWTPLMYLQCNCYWSSGGCGRCWNLYQQSTGKRQDSINYRANTVANKHVGTLLQFKLTWMLLECGRRLQFSRKTHTSNMQTSYICCYCISKQQQKHHYKVHWTTLVGFIKFFSKVHILSYNLTVFLYFVLRWTFNIYSRSREAVLCVLFLIKKELLFRLKRIQVLQFCSILKLAMHS